MLVWVSLVSLVGADDAKDGNLKISIEPSTQGGIVVSIENVSSEDLVIQSGTKKGMSLFRYGMLYKDSGEVKIVNQSLRIGVGAYDYILLAPKQSYSFRIKITSLVDLNKVLHLKVGFDYMLFKDFHEMGLGRGDSEWKIYSKDIIFKKEEVEKSEMKYGFGAV